MVWRTAYRLLHHEADTADCFQEAFLAAYRLAQQKPIRNLKALLLRITTARAIDQLRYRVRRAKRIAEGSALMTLSGDGWGPEDMARKRELAGALCKGLAQLPSLQAEAFCLRYLSDMTQRQIAAELDITTNAAGVLVHRARYKLREILDGSVQQVDEVDHD